MKKEDVSTVFNTELIDPYASTTRGLDIKSQGQRPSPSPANGIAAARRRRRINCSYVTSLPRSVLRTSDEENMCPTQGCCSADDVPLAAVANLVSESSARAHRRK